MTNSKFLRFLDVRALTKAILITVVVTICVLIILPNDPHSLIDTEFKIEGFQRAKIIGISNGRAIVILTNNAGHNSYEEMSLNTVEMLKSLPKEK